MTDVTNYGNFTVNGVTSHHIHAGVESGNGDLILYANNADLSNLPSILITSY